MDRRTFPAHTCACVARPAESLSTRRCTAMQAGAFHSMTGRTGTVRWEESILLGGERCRTTVRLAWA